MLVEKNDRNPSLKVGSVNKYAVLNSLNDNDENVEENPSLDEDVISGLNEEELMLGPRRTRAASVGVAELMRNLKPKRKGPFDKGKSKGVKVGSSTLGVSSNPSL